MAERDNVTDVMDEVLAESAPDDNTADDTGTDVGDVASGTVLDTTAGPGTEVSCTAEEAQALVETARNSIRAMDEAMNEILRVRAWEPLGYDDPMTFWKKEFGPTSGLSRNHVYRTGRVLAVLYGLTQRIGDAALTLDITERHLRGLEAGQHEAFMDAVGDAVPDDGTASKEKVQKIFDEKLTEAKENAAREKAKNKPDLAYDDPDDRLAALSIDRDSLTADTVPDADAADDTDSAQSGSGDGGEPAQGGGVGTELTAPGSSTDVSDEDLAHAVTASTLKTQFAALTAMTPSSLTPALESMGNDDVERLAEQAERVTALAAEIAEYWDGLNDDDAPLDL